MVLVPADALGFDRVFEAAFIVVETGLSWAYPDFTSTKITSSICCAFMLLKTRKSFAARMNFMLGALQYARHG